MITRENEPIYQRADGSYVVTHNGKLCYGVGLGDDSGLYGYSAVVAYLAKHPEALVPEPVPPPPTPEQLAEQERQANLAYLASTDWYAIRYAETGKAVPEDILKARQEARNKIPNGV